jgi:hypothetical protein
VSGGAKQRRREADAHLGNDVLVGQSPQIRPSCVSSNVLGPSEGCLTWKEAEFSHGNSHCMQNGLARSRKRRVYRRYHFPMDDHVSDILVHTVPVLTAASVVFAKASLEGGVLMRWKEVQT